MIKKSKCIEYANIKIENVIFKGGCDNSGGFRKESVSKFHIKMSFLVLKFMKSIFLKQIVEEKK